ncbi:MAG: ATP-binding protein [Lachnospiraceae bacterium]|nr:ATP-binding protein [Lachnospiraceae bacterium]
MNGVLKVSVHDKRNSYKFELHRNITVLCGDSGTGKTTLFEMVSDYNRYGKNSSVKISCNREVIALSGRDWENELLSQTNSLIIIDEDSKFIKSKEFANLINGSSNYFLLITRNYLEQLPISVKEVYNLQGIKNKKFVKEYKEIYDIYDSPSKRSLPFTPEVIITEDSKTGYQFFKELSDKLGIICVSAYGKSNIYNLLNDYSKKNVLVIADGAAFASEMRSIVKLQQLLPKKIAIYLPESFEWLILKSGLINDVDWEKITIPEQFIDSEKYISWERYFTDLLVKTTNSMRGKKYPSNKGKLPDFYLQESSIVKVKETMKGVNLD